MSKQAESKSTQQMMTYLLPSKDADSLDILVCNLAILFLWEQVSILGKWNQLYDTPLTNSSFVDLICSRNVAMIFWYGSSVLSPPSAEGRLSSVPSEAGLSASEAAGLALSSTVKALELLLAIELRSSPSAKLVLDDAAIEAMVE